MNSSDIKHWVFDLDNTLYPPSARLFDQIEDKMVGYMMRELGMDVTTANETRSVYWRNHGTTMNGLMQVHGIDPYPFLAEVHDIDYAALVPDPVLADLIKNLPGQRIIYTNGSRQHGRGVSGARGLLAAFDAVFGIEDAEFVPKPHRSAFEMVFEKAGVAPQNAIMFEDDPRNLEAPKALGMETVLVGPPVDAPFIDHQTEDLTAFLAALNGHSEINPAQS